MPLLEFTNLDHLPREPFLQTEEHSGAWSEEQYAVREETEVER
jgi:hypothetical protein